MISRRLVLFWFLPLVFTVISASVSAHFLLNLNVRIFHVEHRAEGLDLLARLPMPYLLADKTGPAQPDGLPQPAPFTTNRMEGERLVHHVDYEQLTAKPQALGQILADGLRLSAGGSVLEPEVLNVRIHRINEEPEFATLQEATDAFTESQMIPREDELDYVGDMVVDVWLRYRTGEAVYNYSLASTLNPGLPEQEQTANLLLDYAPGDLRVFRARGLMSDPIAVSRSRIAAFWSFIKEGIRHILEGLDHVLFVLCLVAGATGLVGLLWRITGFTIGHSITLSLGFFGFVPKGDWFIPTIEWLIALTIIYAAALVFRKPDKAGTDGRRVFLVTSFIGLIHGLGFSFVLHHILKVTSPNIWQSLLAFNVGIEIGQLAIVLAASVVIWLATRVGQTVGSRLRQVIALACGVMAFYWVIERSLPLIGVA